MNEQSEKQIYARVYRPVLKSYPKSLPTFKVDGKRCRMIRDYPCSTMNEAEAKIRRWSEIFTQDDIIKIEVK